MNVGKPKFIPNGIRSGGEPPATDFSPVQFIFLIFCNKRICILYKIGCVS